MRSQENGSISTSAVYIQYSYINHSKIMIILVQCISGSLEGFKDITYYAY